MLSEKLNRLETVTSHLSNFDREHQRLKIFNQIIVKANESSTQRDLIQSLLNSIIDLTNMDLGSIYLLTNDRAHVVATKFIHPSIIEKLENECNQREEFKNLFLYARTQYIRNYDVINPKVSSLFGDIKTLLAIPILYDGHVKGCISLGSYLDLNIDDDLCQMVRTLGKHLGHVLYRFELEVELEDKIIEVEAYNEELKVSNEQLLYTLHELEIACQKIDQNVR